MHGDTESLTPDVEVLVKAEMERRKRVKNAGDDKEPDISLEEAIKKAWETVVWQHGIW